jgi:hypothetical protein
MTDEMRAAICAEARTWRGARWDHQARRDGWVDCAGLLVVVARKFGFAVPEVANYDRNADGFSLRATVDRFAQRIPTADIKPADFVLVKFPRVKFESHLAWVVDHKYRGLGLLHSLNNADGKGGVIEHGLDNVWRSRITQAYRLPPLVAA